MAREAGAPNLQADQPRAPPVIPAKEPKPKPVGLSAQLAHCPLSTTLHFNHFANRHRIPPVKALINTQIYVKCMIETFCRYTAYPFRKEIPSIARPQVVNSFPLSDYQSL